jgi:serine/threonine protein kinase
MTDIAEGTPIDKKYKVIKKLGFGNAGTVYKVTQVGINVDRAMKVLDPKLPDIKPETFAREFAAEQQKLSQLTHRNLVKLIDAGDFEYNGKRFPYYITDLVHPRKGEDQAFTLEGWAQEVATREAFVNVLLQLTEGLAYLHTHNCLHCDIKPNNLLLEPVLADEYELKIADLGSSKILLPSIPPDTQKTYVVGTVDYAPDYVQNIINTNETVAISDLTKWLPHWDLFSVGVTTRFRDNVQNQEPITLQGLGLDKSIF